MNKNFSHYRIIGPLGVGGMGEVYRAHDTVLGREVALKILPEAFAADPERLARFQREAKLLASLNHPNIAAIHSLAQEGERFGLALELVDGEDLSVRLTRGALSVAEALEIAGQIATALEAAHEQGIIHRDLKPANVKLSSDGTVKVLDFGLAKASDPTADIGSSMNTTLPPTLANTRDGIILGTAAYMSPEQARGVALDKRTDIFSFGVVLFEILTGLRPFAGDTTSDILASILKEQPDHAALPPQTPPAIRLLLKRCLAKDAKQRLRDIGEARLIIEAVSAGDTTAASILGSPVTSNLATEARSPRIRRREIAAWVLAVLTIAILGANTIRDMGVTPPSATAFKLSIPINGEVDLRYTHGGLAISPEGSRVAYINNRILYVRRLDSWEPITIPHSQGASSPFWSPDGQWLAFAIGKELWKIRPDGTQRTLICQAETTFSRTSGGAWLANDRIVFRARLELVVVSASGGNPASFVSVADSAIVDFHEPEALPGGQGLVVGVHRPVGVNTLGIVSLDGSLQTVLTIPDGSLGDPCYSPTGHLLFLNGADLWAVPYSLAKQEVQGTPFAVARNAAVPSVSADGTLAYVRNAGIVMRQLVLTDRTGAITERLGQPENMWAAYALTRDGARAVTMAADQADLWLHDDRQARRRVTFTELEHDMATFSWDGQTLYFAMGIESNYRIGSKSVDSNEPEKTLVPAGEWGPHFYAACPTVTKDGNLLFYSSIGANDKQDIAWLDLTAEAKPRSFITGSAAEYAARPSPADQRYVAYVSDESGDDQVYLTTWPDADLKLPVSIDGGVWPRWKGDGTELYFAIGNDIFAVAVSYDPLQLGRPQKLFTRPEHDDRQPRGWPATFDVTADGQRFLVTELSDDDTMEPRIAIIPNWLALGE